MNSQDQLASEIQRIVAEGWQRAQRPVFLSYLGAHLSPQAKKHLQGLGITLKEYIQRELQGELRLLLRGQTGDLVAPLVGTEELSDRELTSMSASRREKKSVGPSFPRFHRPVWEAFSWYLPEGKRYIGFAEGGPERHDLGEEETPDECWLAVTSDDLPERDPVTGRASAAEIAGSITKWAQKHGIDISKLHAPQVARARHEQSSIRYGSAAERLVRFLEVLSPEDLKRVNIPSDVLLNVLKKEFE